MLVILSRGLNLITVVDGAVQAARRIGTYAAEHHAYVRQRGQLHHLKWIKTIDIKRRIRLEIVVLPRPGEAVLVPSLGFLDDEKIGIAQCDWNSAVGGRLHKIALISNHMAVMAGTSFTSRDFERDRFWANIRVLERFGLAAAESPLPEFRINQDASIDKLFGHLLSSFNAAHTLLVQSCQTTESLLANLQDEELGDRLCLTHDQWIRATAACMVSLGASEHDLSDLFLSWRDRFRRDKREVELGLLEDFEAVFFDRHFSPSRHQGN